VVLTVHVVRRGGHGYYVGDLVAGRARGTLVAGEEPGVWSGQGTSGMGLAGTVEAPVFGDVLDGRHPDSGATLRRQAGHRSVAAYDLTFAAPKSVSILHLLAPREIATEVGGGHRAAVEEATSYLDRAAVGVRRSHRGQVTLLPSTGALAGGFLHRTSRALDPHLHTHLVVANMAEGVDGAWSAVDGRRLFAHAPAAQGIYHARLRLELRERLGVGWQVPPSGLGDVVGVDAGLRHLYSQRSTTMDEYDVGWFGRVRTSGHRQGTFHATRPDKDVTRTVDTLASEWKSRAADFGFDLGDLTRVVGLGMGRGSGPPTPAVDPDRLQEQLGRLANRRSTLSHHDIVAVVAATAVTGATARTVESIATTIAETSGPPVVPDRTLHGDRSVTGRSEVRGMAPRWSTDSVVRAVARHPESLDRAVEGAPVGAIAVRPLRERTGQEREGTMGAQRTPPALDLGR